MTEAYIKAVKDYANFSGRTSRKDFWNFVLLHMLIAIAVFVVDTFFLTGGSIYILYVCALLIPCMSAYSRRLHDTGRSGWLWLLFFTVIGIVPVIIWLAQPGTPGANQYGPDPNGDHGYIPEPPGPRPRTDAINVVCIAGFMCGRVYPIGGNEIVFGRDDSAWVRFPDSEPGVSRVHCRIFRSGGQLMLMDCGSTYGTYLSGVGRLSPQQPVAVGRGATFYLGSKKVGFRLQ